MFDERLSQADAGLTKEIIPGGMLHSPRPSQFVGRCRSLRRPGLGSCPRSATISMRSQDDLGQGQACSAWTNMLSEQSSDLVEVRGWAPTLSAQVNIGPPKTQCQGLAQQNPDGSRNGQTSPNGYSIDPHWCITQKRTSRVPMGLGPTEPVGT